MLYYNNQTDQGDETEGFEMEGLVKEVLEWEGVKEVYVFKSNLRNM